MTGRNLALVAAAGSAALLLGAFALQFVGYAPCKLCLWQRWPHGLAVLLGLFILWRALPAIAWLGAGAASLTAALGLYHTGVERGWWEGPDTCTAGGALGGSADDLLNQIMAAPLIRCDEVAWSLLGLSMASWNMLASLMLAAIWVAAARRL